MAGNSNTINIALKLTDKGTVKGIQQVGTEAKKAGDTGSKSFAAMDSSARKMGSGIGTAISAMTKMGTTVLALAGAGGIGLLISKTMTYTQELQRSAKMAGVSVTAYQELSYAAGQYAITQDALTDGLKELSLRADEFVITGAGSAKEAFQRLKFSQEELNKLLGDTPKLLLEVTRRMENLGSAAQIRIADELFGGTGGEQFVAMLDAGSDAMIRMTKEAHSLGLVMDKQMIQQATAAKREIGNLGTIISAHFNVAVAELAPDIRDLSKYTADWVTQNQALIREKIPEYVGEMRDVVSEIKGAWDRVPDEIKGPAGLGLIGGMMFGAKGAAVISGGAWLLGEFKDFADGLTALSSGGITWSDFFGDEREFEAALERWRAKMAESSGAVDTFTGKIDEHTQGIELYKKTVEDLGTMTVTGKDFELEKIFKAADEAAKNLQQTWRDIDQSTMPDAVQVAREYYAAWEQSIEDADAALHDFFDDIDEQADDIAEANREALEKAADAYDDFSETVQDYTADIISDWDNAGDMLIDIAKRTAAEMAAAFLAEQFIIPVGLSVGSALGLNWSGTPMSSMLGFSGGAAGAGTGSGFGLPGSTALNWAQSNIPGMGWLGAAIPGTTSALGSAGASAGMLYPGATSGAVPAAFSGVTWGSALGAGALGGMGYSLLGGAMGLPQNEWTGLTSGLGSAGGFALGSAYGSVGGPLGAAVGAIAGGLLGSLLGGSDPIPIIGIGAGVNSGFRSDSHDLGGAAGDLESAVQKYVQGKFTAIDEITSWSVSDAIWSEGWIGQADPTDYDEDETQQMIADMIYTAFSETGQHSTLHPGSLRTGFLSAMGLSSDLFSVDFFEDMAMDGEDMLDTFYRFAQFFESFPDMESRILEQMADGTTVSQAYANLGVVSDMMTLAEASITSISSSSTISALEYLVETQAEYIDTMREAGATTEELAKMQTATALELGSAITGLTADTLQSGILSAATSGTSIAASIQDTIQASMAAAIAGVAAENIMDAYIGGLNEQVGDAISSIQSGTMDADSINSVFSDLLGGFDWDGMESSVSVAVDAIDAMLGITEDLATAETALADARSGAADDIQSLINDLLASGGSKVQSMEYFENRYDTLYRSAMDATTADELSAAVSSLTSFVPDYLDYAESYGGGYAGLFDTVVGQLTALQAQMSVESEPTVIVPDTSVTVNVRLGDKELQDMIIDVIRNNTDVHNAINRVVA